jgi:hypothetical protein
MGAVTVFVFIVGWVPTSVHIKLKTVLVTLRFLLGAVVLINLGPNHHMIAVLVCRAPAVELLSCNGRLVASRTNLLCLLDKL